MSPVREKLSAQGWRYSEDDSGHKFEKDGLTLSFGSHWSVRSYSVSSNGGWGNLQEVMSQVGLVPKGDERDYLDAAANAVTIKDYLNSKQWQADGRAARHEGMEKLREFERSIGMKESWIAGEEDHLRQRSEWKKQLSGLGGLKYWAAATVAALYLGYKVATVENPTRLFLTFGAGFAVLFVGLFWLRFQRKI